jgi:molybdate transport system substrate-binding protein
MDDALARGLVVDAGSAFARNKLIIIVPVANPGLVESPIDLAKPGLRVVLPQVAVPAGSAARQSLEKFSQDPEYGAGFADAVLQNLVSDEPNASVTIARVQAGDADASMVYVTDITASVRDFIVRIDFAEQFNVFRTYQAAVTSDADDPELARAFIDLLLSDAGREAIRRLGLAQVP